MRLPVWEAHFCSKALTKNKNKLYLCIKKTKNHANYKRTNKHRFTHRSALT